MPRNNQAVTGIESGFNARSMAPSNERGLLTDWALCRNNRQDLMRLPGVEIGAHYLGDEACKFVVWGPLLDSVEVRIVTPHEQTMPLRVDKMGYWEAVVENIPPAHSIFID